MRAVVRHPPSLDSSTTRTVAGTSIDPISPELALVDAPLREVAREYVPHVRANDHLTPAPVYPARSRPSGRAGYRRAGGAATLAFVAALVLLPFHSLREDDVPAESRVSAKPRAERGVRLHWRAVPGAVFYNVIVWRGRTRVLDLWPRTPSARLEKALAPGTYQWFVYPARRQGETYRYLARSAYGTVMVPKRR